MPAADKTYATPNYEKQGGHVWHVGDTLELGDSIVLQWNGAQLLVTGVPAADPHVVGALWSNLGVLTISAG